MLHQSHECSVCGKRLTYIFGFRGFGLRERRHAGKCKPRAGVIMAMAATGSPGPAASSWRWSVAKEEPAGMERKTVEVESTQVSSTVDVEVPAEECQRAAEQLEDAGVSNHEIAIHAGTSKRLSMATSSPLVLPFAEYYSANFKSCSATAWAQLHGQFPEPSKPAVLEPAKDICEIEDPICKVLEPVDTEEIMELVGEIENVINRIDGCSGENAETIADMYEGEGETK